MSMKKLLLCILSLASAITLSAAPKDAVIEDLKITFMDEVIKSESIPSEVNPFSSPLDRIWEIEFAG